MDREKSVRALAYVVQGREHATELLSVFEERMFDLPEHQMVFRVLKKSMKRAREAPTLSELRSRVSEHMSESGQDALVISMWSQDLDVLYDTPVTENTWDEVMNEATRAHAAALGAASATMDARELKEAFQKSTALLASVGQGEEVQEPLDFFSPEYMDQHQQILDSPDPGKRVLLGFPCLDEASGGFYPGEQVIVLAPTGMGKTFTLVNCAFHMMEAGHSVLFVDLERTENLVMRRMYSRISGVPLDQLEHSRGFGQACAQVQAWFASIRGRFWYLPLTPQVSTTSQLERKMLDLELHTGRPFDVVVVDYGEQLAPDVKWSEYRHYEKAIFTGLLNIGVKHQKVMLIASQSNRSKADRFERDANPLYLNLSDVSESYAKTFGASFIFGVQQKKTDIPRHVMTLNVIKNRKGPSGQAFLFKKHFHVAFMEETYEGAELTPELSATAVMPVKPFPSMPVMGGADMFGSALMKSVLLPAGNRSRHKEAG